MNEKKIDLTVIMPALNEEKNIVAAIDSTIASLKDFGIEGEIVVVNDGSTDKTDELVQGIIKKGNRVRMVRHDSPRGVGASFWDGVDHAAGDIVVMLPGDNENDPWEIFRYYKLIEHVDIIIPFIFNKEVRPIFRHALSFVYRFIINTTFFVNFNYTNGTVVYRKSILKELGHRSSGFFFQTDILIRSAKKEYLFAEVPYRLGRRSHGASKAVSLPSLACVIRGYMRLVKDIYFTKKDNEVSPFAGDSQTAIRRGNGR